jgi:hypothetical protein
LTETPAPAAAVRLRARGLLLRPDTVLRYQRTIGNAAVQRLMHGVIQRDDPPAQVATWRAPAIFDDLGDTVASSKRDGGMLVVLIVSRCGVLRRALGERPPGQAALESIDGDVESITRAIGAYDHGDDPLTREDVELLNDWAEVVTALYREGVASIQASIRAEIRPLTRAPDLSRLDAVTAEAAEALHTAFNAGETGSSIQQLRSVIDTIEEYRSSAHNVVEWSERIGNVLQFDRASRFLSAIGERSAALGDGIQKVQHVLTVATSLSTILGGTSGSEMHNSVSQFRAALDLIDVAMNFADAVPLLGTLWSSYYSPMTRAILDGIERLEQLRDRQNRDLAQVNWMTPNSRRDSHGVPIIPVGLASAFPGGQPVFAFMYRLMNDMDPEVTPAVEAYFAANADRFNAGLPSGRELETESSAPWYDVFASDDRAPELLGWVMRNRNAVWAQLYGAMPTHY